MPFTFSHPAIVLPLTYLPKRYYSLTGLIIGSVSPDFEYFIRMRIESNHSHTLAGLLWFNLPLAVILAFLYHNIVRDVLLDSLPKQFQIRLGVYKNFNWNSYFIKNWIIVFVSIIIGAASHLLWDSFTHETGYFVKKINYLSQSLSIVGKEVQIYKILQHGSTIVGALVLLITTFILPKKSISVTMNYRYWVYVVLITVIILILQLLLGLNIYAYGNVIVSFLSALMIAIVFSSIIYKVKY